MRSSTVTEDRLQDFTENGLLPQKAVVHWRAPLAEHEEPQPEADQIVSFLAFHERGLGYPGHLFLRGVLNKWEVEPQHLNPNGVLHIAGFVTLCEGFLRIDPHANLFRAFFYG
ncbi:putative retrotransposon protein [Panicum miliaceum]|uniref:Retrotransposon protein n=1 Tax=Panicum miliaceum TaxID=4540 RepID=A0A3L6SF40_PANMI|nr:putative retrotransposon protein [Panicum miliaceum]